MTTEKEFGYIVKTPGVCGGKPRIDGHRLRVQDIVVAHQWHGWCPEEICGQYPGLDLSKVHAALAYFYSHRQDILTDIENDEKFVAEFRVRQSNGIPNH